MSQRLIKPGIRAVDDISGVTTAGAIIGYHADGRPIRLIGGGAETTGGDDTPPPGLGDDDEEDEDKDEDDSSDDDSSDEDSDDGKKDSKKDKGDDDEDDKPVYTVAEYQKLKARMKAADANAAARLKELNELKTNARKAEPAAKELETLQKKYDDLEPKYNALRLETAFFKANDVDWVSPGDALKLADLSDVDIDDDGKVDVKALRASLRRLAKDKPFLVKQAANGSKGKKDDDDNDGVSSGGRSAPKMNSRKKGNQPPSRAQLSKRYPVLNT